MPHDRPEIVYDDAGRRISDLAREAYQRFKALLAEGVAPQVAMARVRADFDPKYYEQLADGFAKLLEARWTAAMVQQYRVGKVTLARTLYENWRETSSLVTGIVNEHLKGMQQARELALKLYTGYGLVDGEALKFTAKGLSVLPKALRALAGDANVRRALMSAAGRAGRVRVKTLALRAAYEQAVNAEIAGAAQARIDKLLKVAMEEKLRYFANRIAQTELARAHAMAAGREFMADDSLTVVQWRLSGNHPRDDICDIFASVDNYGLGPGCYPKEVAPQPVAHPFCRCRLRSRPDLQAGMGRFNPGAERAYLAGMSEQEAARLAGSKRKLQRIQSGGSALDAWNSGVQREFRVIRLGDVSEAGRKAA